MLQQADLLLSGILRPTRAVLSASPIADLQVHGSILLICSVCSSHALLMPCAKSTCHRVLELLLMTCAAPPASEASDPPNLTLHSIPMAACDLHVPSQPMFVLVFCRRLDFVLDCYSMFPFSQTKDQVKVGVKVSSSQSKPTRCSTRPLLLLLVAII